MSCMIILFINPDADVVCRLLNYICICIVINSKHALRRDPMKGACMRDRILSRIISPSRIHTISSLLINSYYRYVQTDWVVQLSVHMPRLSGNCRSGGARVKTEKNIGSVDVFYINILYHGILCCCVSWYIQSLIFVETG
jgi:hypothetical protein